MKKSTTSETGLGRRSPLYLAAVLFLAVIIFFVQGGLDAREEESKTAGSTEVIGSTKEAEGTKTTGSPEAAEDTEKTAYTGAEKQYTFRSQKLLEQHYEKHGIEMGFASAEEYLAAANKVVSSPQALHKKEAEDNDDVYYLEESNEFVIVSEDGYIRTYFLPDGGISYYNRQ